MTLFGKLYAKVRADIIGSIGTGGLSVAILYILSAIEVETSADEKTFITLAAAWVGGKVAAYFRKETGPTTNPIIQ